MRAEAIRKRLESLEHGSCTTVDHVVVIRFGQLFAVGKRMCHPLYSPRLDLTQAVTFIQEA